MSLLQETCGAITGRSLKIEQHILIAGMQNRRWNYMVVL